MKKALNVLFGAAAVAAAAITVPAPAQARNEGAIAAGVVGGLAAGAIIGSAVAPRPVYAYPAYAPAPGYVVYSGYYAPYPVACPGGYWARKPVAFDRWGRPVAWSKPRFICP
ncbi:MAG TPA: hypothetical protein VFA53_10345 [Xanthobacteraceae bacterium]|nr:hypothetical protein [Xanthobacteraceae bacterium]